MPSRSTNVWLCGAKIFGMISVLAVLVACDGAGTTARQPVQVINLGLNVDSRTGALMVKKGDTVGHIAERYRLNTRDIIDYNGLVPPYHLSENQRLLLPAPAEHKVGGSDTLLRLSRMYDVSASELVRLNRLAPPYTLNVGQVLRLPPAFKRSGADAATVVTQGAPVTIVQNDAADDRAVMPPQPATPQPMAQTQSSAKPQQSLTDKIRSASKNLGTGTPAFAWPARGRVISAYGPKAGGLYNDGINIAAARGSDVRVAADGAVVYVGSDLHSYGRMVLVRHSDGYVTAYAHLDQASVARGDSVRKGQVIGKVGSTGTVAEPQLHFEIRKGSQTFDPQRYLGS